jgi:hypothetical protein
MPAIGLLQEGTPTSDLTWLVWVALALFLLMGLLGRWASGRLPEENETLSMQEGGHDLEGHGDAGVNHEG